MENTRLVRQVSVINDKTHSFDLIDVYYNILSQKYSLDGFIMDDKNTFGGKSKLIFNSTQEVDKYLTSSFGHRWSYIKFWK